MPLRLAVATEDFGPSIKKSIGLAAELEIPGVRLNTRTELDVRNASETALRQILLYVTERQMQVAGLSCPTKHALFEDEFLEPRLDIIRKSMALARQLNTRELLIRCGHIPDPDNDNSATTPATASIDDQVNPFSFEKPAVSREASPAKKFSTLCQILNDLTQFGNHVGCVLNLQLSTFDLPLIRRMLNEVTGGPLNIVFDPATAVMTGADIDSTYRSLYQTVGYIRARDAVRNVDGGGIEVGVGAGIVDWVGLIPTLAEADYAGWICVERTGGDNRREDVRRGVSELKNLIPQTGD